jgi:hypothetical protein
MRSVDLDKSNICGFENRCHEQTYVKSLDLLLKVVRWNETLEVGGTYERRCYYNVEHQDKPILERRPCIH